MSDIVLFGEEHFISVECKFLSDIHFDKDIVEVQNRIKDVADELKLIPLQVLLMKKKKWENSENSQNKATSFYRVLKNSKTETPYVVLFWEDIQKIINEEKVKKYLMEQLNRIIKSKKL